MQMKHVPVNCSHDELLAHLEHEMPDLPQPIKLLLTRYREALDEIEELTDPNGSLDNLL